MEIKRYIFENKEDWKEARKGLFTGSRISEIMAAGDKVGAGAITYILQLIQNMEAEPKVDYYSHEMEHGTNTEPEAIAFFCDLKGFDLNADDVIYTSLGGTVFFVGDGILGATPDLILPEAICQVKCPNSDTHLRYKLFVNEWNFQDELPKYYDQVQTEMMLCERELCYFFSFDPRFKNKDLQYHTIEVKADKKRQNEIYKKAWICEEKKQQYLTQLKKLTNV